MMASRRKRLYAIVMAIGALALIADRFFLSAEPQTATASWDNFGLQAGTAASPRSASSLDSIPIPEIPFPRDITPLASDQDLPDWFARPELRGDGVQGTGDPGVSGTSRPRGGTGVPRETFLSTHRLHAVFSDNGLQIAIIDAEWRHLGDEVDGCTLAAMDGDKVRFDCFDGSATLSISPD